MCIAALMSGYGLESQGTEHGDAAIDDATLRLLEARSFIEIPLIDRDEAASPETTRHDGGRAIPAPPTHDHLRVSDRTE